MYIRIIPTYVCASVRPVHPPKTNKKVHVRPPDCACAKSGYRIFLNVLHHASTASFLTRDLIFHEGEVTYFHQAKQRMRQDSVPIMISGAKGSLLKTALLLHPPLVCVALLSRKYCLSTVQECHLAAVQAVQYTTSLMLALYKSSAFHWYSASPLG